MKKIILLLFLILSTSVLADKKWDSYYIGASAGVAFGDATSLEPNGGYNGPNKPIKYNTDGGQLSVFGGKNWLLQNNFLIGSEAAIGFMNISNKKQLPVYVGVRGSSDSVASTNNGAFVSLSGKFGKVFNENTLIYLKGGFIQTNIRQSFTDDDSAGAVITDGKSTTRNSSPFIGLGLEYAAFEKINLRAEYVHYNFGSADHKASYTNVSGSGTALFREDFNLDTLSIGILYKY